MDDETSKPDRTPIILGIVALALAACLQWLPDAVGAQRQQPIETQTVIEAIKDMST